jgi:transcriptional regulator with XRE-family HTH domain
MTDQRQEPVEYWIAAACAGFEDDLARLMAREQMSRADLAREYGASTAFISQALNGSTNYTLKTMAKLGRAVRGVLQVRLINEDDELVQVLTFDEAEQLENLRASAESASRPAMNVVSIDDFNRRRNIARSESASAPGAGAADG